jgi:hypothetical protein
MFDSSVTEYAEVLDVRVTTKSGDPFGFVTDASICLNSSALSGRICERRQEAYGTKATIRVDASNALQSFDGNDATPTYLSPCWLDSPGQVDVDIQVCLMAADPVGSLCSWLWFLLLAETQHESGEYIRVGCIVLRMESKLLQMFLDAPKRRFFIV